MSAADERATGELPRDWRRLQRASHDATVALGAWRRRALEAEREVERLRGALEELSVSGESGPMDLREEVRRLRAENAALRSRMQQARQRVVALVKRLMLLGVDG